MEAAAKNGEKQARKKRKNILYYVGMRWRIFIYLLCFAFIMIMLLWLLQIVYLNDFYEYIKKDQIENAATSILSHVEEDDLQQYAEEVAVNSNLCAEVYKVDTSNGLYFGSVRIASVDLLGDCIIHHISGLERNSFYVKARDAGADGYMEVFLRGRFGRDEASLYKEEALIKDETLSKSLVYVRVANINDQQYMVLLNSSITPVSATVAALRVQLVVISIALIVLALIISFMIARRLSSPISQLNDAARRMAKGDLTTNFPASGYKEIAELADSLNHAGSEIARTDRLQKDLVANISHDIRTPLTMIGGYAEYMQDFPGEDHSESIRVIVEETQRLRDLVNDILDSSRLTAGVTEIDKQVFDLSGSLTNFVGNYSHLIEPQGYRVELNADPGILVEGDEKRLLQAISNIMNNAVAHIGGDKLIVVGLKKVLPASDSVLMRLREAKHQAEGESKGRKQRAKATTVRLSVTDHGCGIDKKDLPYIWERYYHVDAPAAGTHSSGLGLSIFRGIMDMHGARYGVDSRPGAGSTFWFELPIYFPPEK